MQLPLYIASILLLCSSVIVGLPVPEDNSERNKHLVEGGVAGVGIGAALTYLITRKSSGATTSEIKTAISTAIGRNERPVPTSEIKAAISTAIGRNERSAVSSPANHIASQAQLSKMTFNELEKLEKVKLAELAKLRAERNKMTTMRQDIAKYQTLIIQSKQEGRSVHAIIKERNPNDPKLASRAAKAYEPNHLDLTFRYIDELTREINASSKKDLAIMSSLGDISAQMRKVTAQSRQN